MLQVTGLSVIAGVLNVPTKYVNRYQKMRFPVHLREFSFLIENCAGSFFITSQITGEYKLVTPPHSEQYG